MKKNFRFILLSIILIITGCATTQEPENEVIPTNNSLPFIDKYASLNPQDILDFSRLMPSYEGDPSNPELMFEKSDLVAIAFVSSVDGGDNKNREGKEILPYTFGTIQLLQIFKGNEEPLTIIPFIKSGGILPADTLNVKNEDNKSYVFFHFEEDILIEGGKTYLVYLKQPTEDSSRENHYIFSGWQGGLRELRSMDNSSINSFSSLFTLEVLNNYTSEWELLPDNILNSKR